MEYTILQAVYKKDNSDFLDQCLESIYKQTIKPALIVLVKDGDIGNDLELIIKKWETKLPMKVVGYSENRGLAHALNYGLSYVTTELIARMDSDDYCYYNRFEKQLSFFENTSDCEICGTGISEFYCEDNGKEIRKIRLYPVITDKKSFSLYKGTPIGHPTVMIKTELLKSFMYSEDTKMNEDIDLWFRLIIANHKIYTIQEPLLNFRITDSTFRRRSIKKAYNEFSIYESNLIKLFGINVRLIIPFLRMLSRFMPYKISKKIYFSNMRKKFFSKEK